MEERLVFATVLVILCMVSSSFLTETSLYQRQETFDNLTFTESLLWTLDVRSRLSCAIECSKHDDCVMFTVTKMTSSNMTCRGHSQTAGSLTETVTTPNTTLFEMTLNDPAGSTAVGGPEEVNYTSIWLGAPCMTDLDCFVGIGASCFDSRCLCIPGYYFYRDLDACFPDCPEPNLQPQTVMYPNWYIQGNSISVLGGNLADCHQFCVETPTCRSFEYSEAKALCYLASITVTDDPAAWKVSVSNVSYYQRMCVTL